MIGTTIQNYQVSSLLGEGGMGKVYLATDTLLGRTVAIKNLNVNLTNQPQFLERFKNEAKTLARLSHPNIALLYNYLQKDDDYFMVMEYVEGENLDQLIRKKNRLPYQLVVPVMLKVLDGLSHAHGKGILHRDIKPANIMLTKDNDVKLMDFGIAKVSDAAKLTQASRVIGTIEFLAPELIEGKDPSEASDIYTVGVTMYEMLTGKLPFTGKSDYMLMQDIVKEKPVNLQKLNAAVPKPLSELVLKALEKKQEKRFPNAKSFLQALKATYPELHEIDSKYLEPEAPATTVAPIMEKQKVMPLAASQIGQPATTVVDMGTNKSSDKKIDIAALLQNKFFYIALVGILVVFSIYKIFSSSGPATDENKDSPVAVHNNSNVAGSDEEKIATNPEQPAANEDSINFIINKKKQEENKVQPGQSGAIDKKPAENTNSKKPGKTENEEPPPKPAPKPEPPLISEPVKLRASAILSLRENITPETAVDGQAVSFKVVEPVEMRGDIIIPAGAVIHGSIKKIGKIRMDLTFNSVTARGRSMRLERSESSGNIRNVLSKGSFKTGLRGTMYP
jgi:serine/threonine protein kinase